MGIFIAAIILAGLFLYLASIVRKKRNQNE
jgi:hypothetical protein